MAYDKGFLEIYLDDHFCELGFYRVSHVILESITKTLLDSMFGWQSSPDFKLVVQSASAVPGLAAATYLNYVVKEIL